MGQQFLSFESYFLWKFIWRWKECTEKHIARINSMIEVKIWRSHTIKSLTFRDLFLIRHMQCIVKLNVFYDVQRHAEMITFVIPAKTPQIQRFILCYIFIVVSQAQQQNKIKKSYFTRPVTPFSIRPANAARNEMSLIQIQAHYCHYDNCHRLPFSLYCYILYWLDIFKKLSFKSF